MPHPFGKPCAAAVDGIVPQLLQRQGSREVAARSATAARVVQTVPCGYPALAGGCRAESSAVWAEVIFAENINAEKKGRLTPALSLLKRVVLFNTERDRTG